MDKKTKEAYQTIILCSLRMISCQIALRNKNLSLAWLFGDKWGTKMRKK